MTVDVRTRIWDSSEQLGRMSEVMRRRPVDPWTQPLASAEEHTRAMAPVTEAFVLGFESRLLEASIPKEQIAEHVARNPARFLGFAGIDPTAGHAVRELEEALSLGLVGVTVSPVAQGFHPANTRAMELFEACEARGVPVFIETGIALAREAPLEFGEPHLLDEVARTFPELRMVLSALAHPWIEQGLVLVGKHPTVFGEISDLVLRPWQLYNSLALAHQLGVMNQLLFGSGFPFCTPEKAIVTVYSMNTLVHGTHLPNVPREQLRSIIERDALKCLGLRGPGRERPGDSSAPASTTVQIDTDSSSGGSTENTNDPSDTVADTSETASSVNDQQNTSDQDRDQPRRDKADESGEYRPGDLRDEPRSRTRDVPPPPKPTRRGTDE